MAVAKGILRSGRREAGDTLIEVTMALSILSMVLISSTVISTQAFEMGQTAKERTEVSTAAQSQMEAVRAFRDNNSWDVFLHGTAVFRGMLTAASSAGCSTSAACSHMEPGIGMTFTPVGGSMTSTVPSSHIEIISTQGANKDMLDVSVDYWFDTLGSGEAMGHIKTTFSDLNPAPSATPVPVVLNPSPGPSPAPTPTPIINPGLPIYLNCNEAKKGSEPYFMDLFDYAGHDWHLNYTQPPEAPHPNSTVPYLVNIPAGNYDYWAISKDASGSFGQSLHFLFYDIKNPVVGVSTAVAQTADTPDLASTPEASTSGTVTLTKDVQSVMAQHATKNPLSPDDGVDAACLVLRPLN